jgi:hypothetical protein
MRALIVPRPGAEPGDHWYPFVAERSGAGVIPGLTGAEVRAPQRADGDQLGSLVLVGHEDGSARVQGFLSSLPGREAPGALLVVPGPPESSWSSVGCLRVLLSDDEHEPAWAELGAEVAIRPGGKGFYGAHEIAVLINLAALAMEVSERGE